MDGREDSFRDVRRVALLNPQERQHGAAGLRQSGGNVAGGILRVSIGAAGDENLDNVEVAGLGGEVERRRLVQIASLDIRLVIEQQNGDVLAPGFGAEVQRGRTIHIARVGLRAFFEEQLDD